MKVYLKLTCLIILLGQLTCKASEQNNSLTSNSVINTDNQTQTVHVVSNLKEFLDALGNNRKIIINHDIYIKEGLKQVVTDISKFFMKRPGENGIGGTPEYINEFYDIKGAYWSSKYTKEELIKNNFSEFIENKVVLIIKKAHNLTITTNNSSNIIIRQSEDEVIRFENLMEFTLLNLSIFHEVGTDGGCGEFAPVISFHNSNAVKVDNCKLNGSGTEGIHANDVKGMTVVNTEIFNCNKRGLSFENSKDVKVINSKIYSNNLDTNSEYYSGPCIFYLVKSEVEIIKTSITLNTSKTNSPITDIDDNSVIKFKECYIADNTNFIIADAIKAGLVKKPIEVIKKDGIYKQYETFFVNAKSGLNYRESPKGKRIGKYPLNTQLTVIEYPKVLDQITDGDKVLKGEWVGVQNRTDTVYVFNAFLSPTPVSFDFNIYKLDPYYKDNNGHIRTAFVNLSETYFENKKPNDVLFFQKELKDTMRLNIKQREKFLKEVNVQETDSVFIYDLEKDKVQSYKVESLPLIASISIYVGESEYEEDYLFGFNLGKMEISYNNFVYVGKDNPFQTNKIKPIVWQKMNNEDFPIKFDPKIINKEVRSEFDGVVPEQSYKFTNNNFDYYIQNLGIDGMVNYRYLVVSNSNEVIFKTVIINSESSYLVPLNTETKKTKTGEKQWTGELFKNKPAILLGLQGFNFGCPYITFLDKKESPIEILCDNRH